MIISVVLTKVEALKSTNPVILITESAFSANAAPALLSTTKYVLLSNWNHFKTVSVLAEVLAAAASK